MGGNLGDDLSAARRTDHRDCRFYNGGADSRWQPRANGDSATLQASKPPGRQAHLG